MSARDLAQEDFDGLVLQSTRWADLEDHQDSQPNTRALWGACFGYLVLMVAVIGLVKFIVRGVL